MESQDKNTRVVVIDDHYLVVQEICTALPWEEYGFKIVGTAKNGLLGLELCEPLLGIGKDRSNIIRLSSLLLCIVLYSDVSTIATLFAT